MILEVAVLDIKAGQEQAFEAAFELARPILAGTHGHLGHQLQRCLEHRSRYLLLVHWERLEDHTQGFRDAPEYQRWKALLHHFYQPFPEVEHYISVVDSTLTATI